MGGHAGLEMGICSWCDRMRARMVESCTIIYLKDSETFTFTSRSTGLSGTSDFLNQTLTTPCRSFGGGGGVAQQVLIALSSISLPDDNTARNTP